MIKVITGNEAAAYGALLAKPEVVCAYPITPQSRIPEQISEFYAQGIMNGKFVNVESEMAALGFVTGASMAGVRVFTATSSQGLAWMHEGLHWAAGARLPIVMVNVNRPMGAPWNLTCEQTDSLSQRDTGWMQFYCESVQEILDTVIQAYKISESISIPAMVCLDGVYLSYLSETVDIPDQDKVDAYLPEYKPTSRIPGGGWKLYDNEAAPSTHDPRNFMLDRYHLHKLESQCLNRVIECNDAFDGIFGRSYPPVEEYLCDDAEVVVVISGSAVGTCRYVIDRMREKGEKVGMVKLKMFRPFPAETLRHVLEDKKKIMVIERDLSPGQGGIFCQELRWAMSGTGNAEYIYGFVSGLGGADITPDLVEKAVRFTMDAPRPVREMIWLGLTPYEDQDEYDRNTIKIQ
ncbi:MAG: pyruvate ferredoxin oxidoreductase [Deltaproteobacteria bacterium]|nr:pyruvate ferredoxin oxidoreductase [Deltaproteobacteria bacterium]